MVAAEAPLNPVELSTLITAVCALIATVWQAAITRQHNKLSVRPVLTLYRREIDGVISLRNNGTGPAIVKQYEVYKNGNRVPPESMKELLPSAFDAPELTVNAALAPGEVVELIKSATYLDNTHVAPMESLQFRVVYQSIYGQEWVLE